MTVLIWGSTWIAIKFQLGTVDPMVSVVYRFAVAAALLLAWCLMRRLPMRFRRQDHFFMLLQGLLLFGFNYLLFYIAELHVTSGLAAVAFSTILVMNMVNGALFLRTPIAGRVVVGGALGLAGIGLVFRPEITSFSLQNSGLTGVLCCLLATFFASLGNIISVRHQKNGLPVVQTNAYGMGYGALGLAAVTLAMGKPYDFEATWAYGGSLIYLSLFGSVIAFGCYLTLVGNIGAARAAYATLLFPIVALAISTVYENYIWTLSSAAGMACILAGNFWMLEKGAARKISASIRRMLPPLWIFSRGKR